MRIIKKTFSFILIMSLCVSALSASIFTTNAATKHTQNEAVAWAKSKIGQYLDYDGAYGAQCVDLIAYYYAYLGTTTPGGNACDYTKNKLPSGWKRINNYSGLVPQPGDIAVWNSYAKLDKYWSTSQYGHVGIVTSGNSSTFNTIEQNVEGSACKACSGRITSYATCFIRPDFITTYNIAYNANGGTGTMASRTIKSGETFTPSKCTFTKNGYYFAGYNVCRKSDSKWYVSGKGWITNSEITNSGYTKAVYYNGSNYTFNGSWVNGVNPGETYTFYPVWKPNSTKLWFYPNYSGCNYIMGGGLDSKMSNYINSRDTSIYTLSVDSTQRLNNQNSIKITATSGGSSGHDMLIRTSTNQGHSVGVAGDNRKLTLTFWAKASVSGAKMYFRWGYNPNYNSVSLTTEWEKYSIDMTKNIYSGGVIHPYIDKAGTFWVNNLTLCDGSNGTRNYSRYEDGYNVSNQVYSNGNTYSSFPTPVRNGYKFLGWFTQNEGGTQITTSTKVFDYDTNVYAHWEKNVSDSPISSVISSEGKKYELYDNALDWATAKKFCEEKGGHLVTINSYNENELVYNMIKNKNQITWIGASYNTDKSKWLWVTNEPFNYTNWADGQPSNSNSQPEYYAHMYPFNLGVSQTAGKWNDANGGSSFSSFYAKQNSNYICEYEQIMGDVNNDGKLNILDATLIQKYIAELDTFNDSQIKFSDINNDGQVNVHDVTYIQKKITEQ